MKPSELKKQADALLESGIANQTAYRTAVPLLFNLRAAAATVKAFAKALESAADELGDKAAAYAVDHVSAFDEPLAEVKDGIRSGVVSIDEVTYRLTISPDAVKRLSGDNLTQGFLRTLPKGWTNSKLTLAVSELADVPAEKLAENDLYRAMKRVWSFAKAA